MKGTWHHRLSKYQVGLIYQTQGFIQLANCQSRISSFEVLSNLIDQRHSHSQKKLILWSWPWTQMFLCFVSKFTNRQQSPSSIQTITALWSYLVSFTEYELLQSSQAFGIKDLCRQIHVVPYVQLFIVVVKVCSLSKSRSFLLWISILTLSKFYRFLPQFSLKFD